MSFLRDHNTTSEQETIERHRLEAELLNGPVTSEVRPDVVSTTEPGASDEGDVCVLTNRAVRRDDRLMEVFTRVMTASASTSPLQDDGEVGVGSSDVDDLTNALD